MLHLEYTGKFFKYAKKLPVKQQTKLINLLDLLSKNPFNKKLHTKPLTGKLIGFYSFRITREWRVIFKFMTSKNIQLIFTGHRKDIYKKKLR